MFKQLTSVVGGMGLWQLKAGGCAELIAELDDLLYNDARKCHRLHLQVYTVKCHLPHPCDDSEPCGAIFPKLLLKGGRPMQHCRLRTGTMVGLTMSKAGVTEKLGCTAPAASAATLADVVELPLPPLLPDAEPPPPVRPAAEVVVPVDDAEEPGVVMVLLLPPDEAANERN
jgi:hypothetical protein